MPTKTLKLLNVAIVAPGFAPSYEVQKKIKEFAKMRSEFKFHFPAGLIKKNPLFSNEETQRAKYLVEALKDDAIDIIWCLRGGYGSLPLLKYLKDMSKPKKQKCLIGLSDITSLHLFMNQFWGWSSVHGSNLDRWVTDRIPSDVLAELLGVLKKTKPRTTYKNVKPVNILANKLKSVKGEITGGNLITLSSHLGTPFQKSYQGRFLFIEEIGERAYKIDRCLTQLSLSGVLKGCRGILLGQFMSCFEPDGKELWPWVIERWAKDIGIPVYSGVPSGHEEEQWPISFGTPAEIKIVNDRRHLIIENKI